jgi:hypothetical protein
VGIIWNPKADGKTVVRGAYCRHGEPEQHRLLYRRDRNPPIVTPLSAQASGTAASNIKLDNAINGAGAATSSGADLHRPELPAGPDAVLERQRRARDRPHGRDGRLLSDRTATGSAFRST